MYSVWHFFMIFPLSHCIQSCIFNCSYYFQTPFQDWELRHYGPTKWVSTNTTAMFRDDVTSQLFSLLFRYISKENAARELIFFTEKCNFNLLTVHSIREDECSYSIKFALTRLEVGIRNWLGQVQH